MSASHMTTVLKSIGEAARDVENFDPSGGFSIFLVPPGGEASAVAADLCGALAEDGGDPVLIHVGHGEVTVDDIPAFGLAERSGWSRVKELLRSFEVGVAVVTGEDIGQVIHAASFLDESMVVVGSPSRAAFLKAISDAEMRDLGYPLVRLRFRLVVGLRLPDGIDDLVYRGADLLLDPDAEDDGGDAFGRASYPRLPHGAPLFGELNEAVEPVRLPKRRRNRARRPFSPADVGILMNKIAASRLQAHVPSVAPAPTDATFGTRSFGRAWIPSGTSWPERDGRPMVHGLQLDVATLPEAAQDLLGGKGLFQFFYDPDEPGAALMRLVTPALDGDWQDQPPVDDQERKPRIVTGWRAIDDQPFGLGDGEEGQMFSRRERDLVDAVRSNDFGEWKAPPEAVAEAARIFGLPPDQAQALADAVPHWTDDKLLGWPTWEQGVYWPTASDGRRMVLLWQFQFMEWGADHVLAEGLAAGDGVGYIFVTTEGEPEFAWDWATG